MRCSTATMWEYAIVYSLIPINCHRRALFALWEVRTNDKYNQAPKTRATISSSLSREDPPRDNPPRTWALTTMVIGSALSAGLESPSDLASLSLMSQLLWLGKKKWCQDEKIRPRFPPIFLSDYYIILLYDTYLSNPIMLLTGIWPNNNKNQKRLFWGRETEWLPRFSVHDRFQLHKQKQSRAANL